MKTKDNILALKKYWQIIYAILLIITIPVAIIANTVWITQTFRKNIDKQLQRQALGLADALNAAMSDRLADEEAWQSTLNRIAEEGEDLRLADIMIPDGDGFKVIASLTSTNIGKVVRDVNFVVSWHQDQGIAMLTNAAFLTRNDPFATRSFENLQERFWSVTFPLSDAQGEQKVLISLHLSLSNIDELVQQTLVRSYGILALTVCIVMLLLILNTRLFQYAVLARKLKEVEQLKDEFISMASHELRTPITSLRGYLSMLSEGALGEIPDLAKEKVKMMLGSAERLNELVEDLLNVSRIEQGRLSIYLEKVDLAEVVVAVMGELDVQAKEKGLAFTYQKPAQPLPPMLLDPNRLKQVLINIIGNAVKYTPKGSVTVTTVYNPDENEVTIKCEDTGLGMTAKEREHLFEKFYRVKTKETETIKGTGLGLWITKQLIVLMNGEIFIDSLKGVGTQMSIVFPVRDEAAMEKILAKQAQSIKAAAQKTSEQQVVPPRSEV